MKAQTFKEAAATASRVGGMSDVAVSFADACVAFGEARIRERKLWRAVHTAEWNLAIAFGCEWDHDAIVQRGVSELISGLRAARSHNPELKAYNDALDAWSDACDAERNAEEVLMSYSDIVAL